MRQASLVSSWYIAADSVERDYPVEKIFFGRWVKRSVDKSCCVMSASRFPSGRVHIRYMNARFDMESKLFLHVSYGKVAGSPFAQSNLGVL